MVYIVASAEYFYSHRYALALAALNKGYKVSLIAPRFQKNIEIDRRIEHFFWIVKRGSVNPLKEFLSLIKLNLLLFKLKPDTVHAIGLKPALYSSLYLRWNRVCAIFSINGFGYLYTHEKKTWLSMIVYQCFKRLLNFKFATVVVQNKQDYQDCSAMFSKAKVKLIPGSGVDLPTLDKNIGRLSKKFSFILVSRMLFDKGVQEYVDAATNLKAKGFDADFFLVGEPDSENPARIPLAQLKAWHAQGAVIWFGYREDIISLYQQIDVAVLPSYREGMPKSLLEAMACAKPILTTSVRGCEDLIDKSDCGKLVEARNSMALENAMCWFIKQNPESLKNMGQKGRNKISQKFAMHNVNLKFLTLY